MASENTAPERREGSRQDPYFVARRKFSQHAFDSLMNLVKSSWTVEDGRLVRSSWNTGEDRVKPGRYLIGLDIAESSRTHGVIVEVRDKKVYLVEVINDMAANLENYPPALPRPADYSIGGQRMER